MIHLLRIDLRLLREVRFPFHHGRIVYGVLSRALSLPPDAVFPDNLLPLAPESGRCLYDEGSPYALGLVLLGDPSDLWALVGGLSLVGLDARLSGNMHLGGDFRLN